MDYGKKEAGLLTTSELTEMQTELTKLRQEVVLWRTAGDGVPGLHDLLALSAENARIGVSNVAFKATEYFVNKGMCRDNARSKSRAQAYLTALIIQASAQELAIAAELRYQIKILVRDVLKMDGVALSDMSTKIINQFKE